MKRSGPSLIRRPPANNSGSWIAAVIIVLATGLGLWYWSQSGPRSNMAGQAPTTGAAPPVDR